MKQLTLKQFRANLNTFIKDNPKALNLPVITASDDAGNYFNGVFYAPSIITAEVSNDGFKTVEGVCLN